MLRRGVATRSHRMHGESAHCGAELHDAHVCPTCDTVASLQSRRTLRVVREHSPVLTAGAKDRNARSVVGELLVLTLIDALQPIHFAPRNLPRSPIMRELRNGGVERSQSRIPAPASRLPPPAKRLLPTIEKCHRDRRGI